MKRIIDDTDITQSVDKRSRPAARTWHIMEHMRHRVAIGLALAAVVLLMAEPLAQFGLRAVVHATGFTLPVAIVQDPTNRSVQFVVEQGGRIRVVSSGAILPTDFLTLTVGTGSERGLLGLALAPNYATSGRLYVNFTNTAGHTVVARFRRSAADPLRADPTTRFDLRWGGPTGPQFITQPYDNHNGGHLLFGPDGNLWIGLGDGGWAGDPQHRAQNPAEFLGKMLRLDVSVPDTDPTGYRVPPDNPFVSGGPPGTRPEIWSFGLRNPWRYWFDDPARGGTGALLIGDVGQNAWEEIDYEPAGRGGRNYGWRNREGAHDYNVSQPPAYLPLVDPIHEYDRATGTSVTGGIVYRGQALGSFFRGRYFFADYVRGRVWSAGLILDASGEARVGSIIEHTSELGGSPVLGNISSFGTDADGEMFIVNYAGRILRVSPVASPTTPTGLRIIR
jgi:glucose/arabinose dehydrogenase